MGAGNYPGSNVRAIPERLAPRRMLSRHRARPERNAMGRAVLVPIVPKTVRQANKRGAATRAASTAVVHAAIEKFDGAVHLRLTFRAGGKQSSPSKTAAVQANGRKGGRPRNEAIA